MGMKEEIITVDIETYDPHLKDWGPGSVRKDGRIIGIGIYGKQYKGFFRPEDPRVADILKTPITKVFHNGVYDLDWLMNGTGLEVNGRCEDTMTRETLLDSYAFSYSLDSCCQRRGIEGKNKADTIEAYWKAIGGKGKAVEHLNEIPFDIVGKYCVQDCKATYELFYAQQPLLEQQELLRANDIEVRLYPLLMSMRKNGFRIDVPKLLHMSDVFTEEYDSEMDLLRRTYNLPSLSLNSANDLYKIWKQEGLPIEYTPTGKPSFTAEILENCNHPIAEKVHYLKGLIKTNAFLDSWVDLSYNNHLYPSFYPAKRDEGGTVTGRWSSANPNCVTMDVRALTDEGYKYFDPSTKVLQTATGIKEVIGTMNAQKRPVVRITTVDGHHIGATEDSKVATWTAKGIQWKEYRNLTLDDYVLIKIGSDVVGNKCSISLAYMLGALGAEGWHLNFWNSNFDYVIRYKECASEVWGYNIPIRESIKSHGWEAYVKDSYERRKKCEEWGFDYKALAKDKRVPDVIMRANKEAIIAYLQAYIEGDGCIHKRQVAISSISLGMIRDIQLLLLRIGIYSFVEGPYRNNIYHLKISGLSLNVFSTLFGSTLKGKKVPTFQQGCAKDNIIPLILPYMNEKYGKYSKNGLGGQMSRKRAYLFKDEPLLKDYIENDLQAVKIGHIEYSIEDVYDYTVPTTEGILGQPHFIANGFVQFDCQQIPARADKHGDEIRSLFIPEEGCLLGAFDFKQIEYRVFTHFAQGPGAKEAQSQFHDHDVDYHQMVQEMMGWVTGDKKKDKEFRHITKNLNFTCISPDSFIATKRGYIRAKDLHNDDLLVLDSGKWRAFIGRKPQYRFTLSNGQQFCVTTNHPFKLFGKRVGASELKEGDAWDVVPNRYWGELQTDVMEYSYHRRTKQYTITVDEDFAYLLGVWLGDGSVHMQYKTGEPSALSFCTPPSNTRLLKDTIGGKTTTTRKTDKWEVWMYTNKALASWVVRNCGRTDTKHVPDIIYRSPRNVVIALLTGFLDSDGATYNNKPQLINTNEELMRGLARCVAMLGWKARWAEEDYDSLGCTGKLYRLVLNPTPELMKELQGVERIWHEEGKPVTIVKKEEIGIQDTFCIELPPPHWYEAECCINHNSIYGLGPRSFAQKFHKQLLMSHPDADPDNLTPLATSLMNEYFAKIPFVKPTCNKIMDVGQRRGYVKTLSGRRQRMPLDGGAYKLINYLIQGSAADILKKGLVDAWEKGVFNTLKLHATVHDESVFSIPETKEGYEACLQLYDCLIHSYRLNIPLGVDTEIGPDWGHCDEDNWNNFKKEVTNEE